MASARRLRPSRTAKAVLPLMGNSQSSPAHCPLTLRCSLAQAETPQGHEAGPVATPAAKSRPVAEESRSWAVNFFIYYHATRERCGIYA